MRIKDRWRKTNVAWLFSFVSLIVIGPFLVVSADGATKAGDVIDWFSMIIGLLGGLALFLFGMEQMSSAIKAVAGDQILANTTSNPITVTLPASPATGDEVSFLDARGTFASNNLIVDRNGQPINTGTSNLTISTAGQSFSLVYVDSTRGWAYKTNTA